MTAEEISNQDAVAPRKALVICSSPRSGSYLLSEGLESTQVLGCPQEYFDTHEFKRQWWIDRLGITSEAEYWDKVVARGSTPNGIFGVKIHWFQIPDVALQLAAREGELLPAIEPDLHDCLRRRFEEIHYIWLRRKNKIAQGISYYRAVQSGIWHVRADKKLAPGTRDDERLQFNFDEIDQYVGQIEEWEDQWQAFFSRNKLPILSITYEDFIGSPPAYDSTIREVAKFVGLPSEGLKMKQPAFLRQADGLSLEWEQKYRAITVALRKRTSAPARQASAAPIKAPVLASPIQVPLMPPVARPAETASVAATPRNPDDLPFIAYDLNPTMAIPIEMAPARRDWMDATPERYVYRCLPLVIANQHGWLLRCPCRIRVVWTGGQELDALTIEMPHGERSGLAGSHFGFGIVTFSVNYLFRTPPGFNLHVRGPANMPKDGIAPLEGIVETDWTEATFTMNWKVTRPYQEIVFEKGEPFAMISPVARGEIERFQPEIRSIGDDPALAAGYRAWAQSRTEFNRNLGVEGSEAQQQRWQRHYVRGETVAKRQANEHQTGLSLRDFVNKGK